MAPQIPTSVPDKFVAGDTVKFKRSYADYPTSESWAAKFAVRGVTSTSEVVTATVDGSEFLFTIPATGAGLSTDDLAPGTYHWYVYVEKAGERYTVESGTIVVLANLATSTTYRTHAEKTLALIIAAIEGRIPADMQEYTIAGRAITKIPITELHALKVSYEHRVWRERNGHRVGPSARAEFRRAG